MQDEEPYRRPTKFELVLDLIKSRFIPIALLLLGAGVALAYFDVSLEVPRWAKLAGLTFIALAPVGFIAGNYITGLLWNPNHIFLVDLDARVIDGGLYRFPYSDFREITVTDENGNGEAPYEMTQLTPSLYVGKSVDLEEMTVIGTWRGTLDDTELVRALGKIRECRGQLQDAAQRGQAIENSAFSLLHGAAQDEIRHIVDSFADGTLASEGESIANAVEQAIEEQGFEEGVGDSLADHAPAESDLDPRDGGEKDVDDLLDADRVDQPQPEPEGADD
jgi:hypothetical protein